MVHGGARAAQSTQQAVGQYLIIFGDQYTHACLLALFALCMVSASAKPF
jgi:hypothetical protein